MVLNEKTIGTIYAGTLWDRWTNEVSDGDLPDPVAGEYIYKAAAAVLAGAGADRVLLFPHVFAEYFRAQWGEPEISFLDGRDSQELYADKEPHCAE